MDCAYQFDNFRAVATTVVIAVVIAALLLMANQPRVLTERSG